MEMIPRRVWRISRAVVAFFPLVAALGLCAFQYGDKAGLNSLPYAQVRALASDLPKAERLGKEGNIDMLAGQTVTGKDVAVRGELTDANCYMGSHIHAYDHAFCAKLCAAAGSPLVFVPDQGGPAYVVLTPQNGVPLSENLLDQIGVPGIVVQGRVLESNDVKALAIAQLKR
jgi:hypothetical protein